MNQSTDWLLRHWFTTESIMKVVGYGRCSTAEQAAKGVSIEVQRRAVERSPKAMAGI
jgi:hypothetical protein